MSPSMSVVLALLCVLYCSEFCLAVQFQDCGSTLGKFTKVSVSGCKASDEKCDLVRGTNATINITLIPNKDCSKVEAYVYGVLWNIPIPFPLNKPNACTDPNDGLHCPLHKDQEYTYTTSLFVEKKYPSVSVDIKWEFVNENKVKIVCVEFPAAIV